MFEKLIVVAALVESIVTTLKPIWDPEKRKNAGEFYAALAFGIVVSVTGGFDIFAALDVPLNFLDVLGEWPGLILSGILLGNGASYIHDILKRVRG